MEKVSVIIPTYNREKTILRAIQSVLDQTYTNLEVLIIDDGSTDGTAEIVKGIEDDRVKYVVLEQNGGPSKARNIGVQMAEGEWIAFQDSDDCWHENKLEVQMAYAKEHPEYAMIYCSYNATMYYGGQFQVPSKPWPDIMEGNMLNTLFVRNVIGAPTIVTKKEAFLASGGFDTAYKCLEDWEFVLRFSRNYEIGFVKEALIDCYVSNSGVSANPGAFYDARCRMLGQYKMEMMQMGVLEQVMEDILVRAEKMELLEPVKKMMMLYLSQ